MARIRSIKIGFFQNEVLSELSANHRLLFIGLWLLADRDGRLEDRPKRIKAEIFPYQDMDVARLCHDLFTAGFIVQYQHDGLKYIQVVNFDKHQHPHPREAVSTIPAPEPCNFTARHDLGTVEPGGSGDLGLGDLCSLVSWNGGQALAPDESKAKERAEMTVPRVVAMAPLVDGREARRHGEHIGAGCDRGLCVDMSLHRDFIRRLGGDGAEKRLLEWYPTVIAKYDKQAVGDDRFDFWRNEFAAWVGIVTAKPSGFMTKGTMAKQAAERAIEIRANRAK